MSVDSDGIEESVEHAVRVAVTVAGRVGEQLARVHEENLNRARVRSEQAAREYTARLAAERQAARAQLAPVHHPQWWATAGADAIGEAYTTARAWEDRDPEAARASHRIRTELRDRYGIDADAHPADPATVQAALARATDVRLDANAEHTQARQDAATGAALVAEADAINRRVHDSHRGTDGTHELDPATSDISSNGTGQGQEAGIAYDSAERREAMAAELEGMADQETIRARVVADTSQARPPHDAVLARPTRTSGATRTGPAAQRQRGRSGLGR